MMDKFYRVEGHSQVVKNPSKGTLLNTNSVELNSARKRKLARKENEQKQNRLEQEVRDLKSQIDKLTSVIEQLVEK
jgi:TolA-binding protein